LFSGLLKVREACPACGKDFRSHDAGDGPVFFAILLMGALLMGLATLVEIHIAPPMWVHALVWLPLTAIGCVLTLRWGKARLIGLEQRLKESA
jgi:uncharacterized protein (DUF983 family)